MAVVPPKSLTNRQPHNEVRRNSFSENAKALLLDQTDAETETIQSWLLYCSKTTPAATVVSGLRYLGRGNACPNPDNGWWLRAPRMRRLKDWRQHGARTPSHK